MARNATIYKVHLSVADTRRDYYADHRLVVAKHPSESDERMMIRILVFAMHASDQLQFGRGVSTHDEPDLWRCNENGDIELWIDLGQPDEKRLNKACKRADQVVVYTYSDNAANDWWQHKQKKLTHWKNLSVINIPTDQVDKLSQLTQRGMTLKCNIQDDVIWINDEDNVVQIEPTIWLQ